MQGCIHPVGEGNAGLHSPGRELTSPREKAGEMR